MESLSLCSRLQRTCTTTALPVIPAHPLLLRKLPSFALPWKQSECFKLSVFLPSVCFFAIEIIVFESSVFCLFAVFVSVSFSVCCCLAAGSVLIIFVLFEIID